MKEAQGRLADAKKRLAELRIDGQRVRRRRRRPRALLSQSAPRVLAKLTTSRRDEAFHEWRKGAQAHWRQMTLLARAWPEYLGARASEARTLSQLLGDDHDLAMLVAFVHSDAARASAASRRRWSRRPRASVRPSCASARSRAASAYSPTAPKRLRRSIGVYWQAAVCAEGARVGRGRRRDRRQSASAGRAHPVAGSRRTKAPPRPAKA